MIYKGSVKQNDIYIGSTKISEVYKGSTQVYSSKLPAGQVIFESSTAGTYEINIPKSQNYYIQLVGGGGGGRHVNVETDKGGGSGGYVYGTIHIPAGVYSIIVGKGGASKTAGGDSVFIEQVAGGGKSTSSYAGGVCTTTLNYINGKAGGSGKTGQSVYEGYGAGGFSSNSGKNGYAKITTA